MAGRLEEWYIQHTALLEEQPVCAVGVGTRQDQLSKEAKHQKGKGSEAKHKTRTTWEFYMGLASLTKTKIWKLSNKEGNFIRVYKLN